MNKKEEALKEIRNEQKIKDLEERVESLWKSQNYLLATINAREKEITKLRQDAITIRCRAQFNSEILVKYIEGLREEKYQREVQL